MLINLSDTVLTVGETARVEFIFPFPVIGFEPGDIDLARTSGTLSDFTGSATAFTATFTPTAGVERATNTIAVQEGSYSLAAPVPVPGPGGTSSNFVIDTKPPTVAVAIGDASLTAGETATVTFSFSEPVTGFAASDISLAGTAGALAGLRQLGGNVWTATFTPTADVERPTNTIAVEAGSYVDLNGNPGAGGSTASFAIDTRPPTVSVAISDTSLVAGETATVTFTFSEPVTGFAAADIALAAAGRIAGLTQASPSSWAATFTPDAGAEQAANTIGVRAGSYTDLAGNPGAAGRSPTFAVDTKPPTVAVAISDTSLVAGETATVTFTFSEPVAGFAAADIDLAAAAGSLGGLTQTGPNIWTATFTPTAGAEQATNTIAVRPGSYTDVAGNPGAAGRSAGFAVDTKAPTVTIALGDTNLIAGETATVTFTFSEPVTGFALSDIDVAAAGSLGGLTQASRTSWLAIFTPTAGAEQASNTIAVKPGSYTDVAGNPGVGTVSPGFAIDSRPPTVLGIGVSDVNLTAGETATVTFSFSEPVTGFDLADIDLSAAAGTLSALAGTGAMRTATFTPTAGVEQPVNTIAVKPGGYTDLAGNPGGAGGSARFVVDTKPPTVAVTVSDPVLTKGETATVTFTFSEAVAGFTIADIDLGGAAGSLSGLSNGRGNTWTATFTPGDGIERAANTIAVKPGSYTDLAGNPGAAGSSAPFAVDTRPPTLSVAISDNSLIAGETATVSFTFSEPVSGFALSDIDLAGAAGTLGPLTGTGATRTAVFTPTPGVEQLANTITVAAGSYTDLAGNPGGAGATASFAVDTRPPTVAIEVSDALLTRGETATVSFAFSEPVFGFTSADIDLARAAGTIAGLARGDGNTWTATFTPTADFEQATNVIAVTAGSYTDLAGNPGAGSTSRPFSVDTGPAVPPGTRGPIAVDDEFAFNAATLGKKGAKLTVLANDLALDAKLAPGSLDLLEQPANGEATVRKGAIFYQPDQGFAGTELLTYTVQDKAGLISNVAQVTITVTQPPLPLAVDDNYLLDATSIPKKGARLDILANDVAGFGKLDPRSVVITDAPENGAVTLGKGVLFYTPDPGVIGLNSLRYTVADATGRASDPATVTIDVRTPAALALADLIDDGATDLAVADRIIDPQGAVAALAGSAAASGLDTLVIAGDVV